MACRSLDFHDAEQATRSMPILPSSQYQPQTMTVDSPRACYLPSFPRKNIIPRGEFLLANVPGAVRFILGSRLQSFFRSL